MASPPLEEAALTVTTRSKHEPGILADFDRLASALGRGLDSLAATLLTGIFRKHPNLDSTVSRADLARLTRASLRTQLRAFRRGALPERCPEVDSAAVATLARPVGLPVLLDGYRLCQVTLWQSWFELVEDSGLEGSQRRELLSRGSDFFFRYADLLGGFIAETYEREVGLPGTPAEQRRFRAIKELLEGDPLAASWLYLDLERHHLGLIAWGEDPAAAAAELAGALGRPLISIPTLEGPPGCWGWISGTRPLGSRELARLAEFQPTAGRVAIGLEAFGEEGFRSSHRQALRASRFAPEDGAAILRYEDVVVEVLACENEEDARAFVAHELRGIEDDSPASRRLRETLAAYFAAEYNAASAGARLGVHQQTVANRLRAAEERMGQTSIGLRRVELEMALRLREHLSMAPR